MWKWTWSSQLKEVIEKEPEEIQAWLGFKPWLLNDWTPCSIHFTYFNSCYFHYQEYYILTMACSPVGFFISMDRALCLVATKVMVWFLVNPENFQVVFLFLPLSSGIIFSRSIQIVLKKKCDLRFFLPFWIIYCCSTHLICCTATRGKQSNYFLIFYFVLAKSGSGHHSFLLLSREDSSMVCKQAQVVEQT